MKTINSYLQYLPSSQEPLSSNVYFINGKDNTYIYDVGRNDEAYNQIQNILINKTIVISHFHGDHLDNINRVTYSNLYVSNYTHKHINKGTIVSSIINIDDGIKLEIIPASSVHSKGSLLLNINNEYCLIGDLVHYDGPLNKSLYCMMIQDLEKVNTEYFVMGHGTNCIYEKNVLIESLRKSMI